MQRQSLGSPNSKLHSHGGVGAKEDSLSGEDQKHKDQACSLTAADEDNEKSQKPHKLPLRPERFIHCIPLLTVFCFLILYLSSHDPSQKDMAQFSGFKRLSKSIDSTEIDDIERFFGYQKRRCVSDSELQELAGDRKTCSEISASPENRLFLVAFSGYVPCFSLSLCISSEFQLEVQAVTAPRAAVGFANWKVRMLLFVINCLGKWDCITGECILLR